MAKTNFEPVFRSFAEGFGAECPEDGKNRSADYFFKQYNVIAELKCLVEDKR